MERGASSSFFSRMMPKSIVGQLVLATAVLLFIAQAMSFTLLARGHAEQRTMRLSIPAANRIIDVADRLSVGQEVTNNRRARRNFRTLTDVSDTPLVDSAMHQDRRVANQISEILEEANLAGVEVRAADLEGSPESQSHPAIIAIRDEALQAENPARIRRMERRAERATGRRDEQKGPASNTVLISAQIEEGRWVNIIMRSPKSDPQIFILLGVQTVLLYLLLLAPIAWIGWRVSRPLKMLTNAARDTTPAAIGTAVPESGPADVRDLTAAFNKMRSRIGAMLGEKDRMLGALGHDLRTPLASLRVRVESVEDETLRTKMIATMDEMAAMLDDILSLARSGQNKEAMVATDIGALLSAITEDYRDTGLDVSLVDGAPHVVRTIDVVPMRRAIRNLTDNAIKYGKRARLSLTEEDGRAVISIADDGPGIAPDRIAEMLEPFTRAEESRSRETGGAGLGLALAKAMVTQQGGDLQLQNASAGGLLARIILPSDAA